MEKILNNTKYQNKFFMNKQVFFKMFKDKSISIADHQEFKNSKEIALLSIEYAPSSIVFFSKKIQNDIDVVHVAMKVDAYKYIEFPKKFQNNKELFLSIVKIKANILRYASEVIKEDREFVKEIIIKRGSEILYTPSFHKDKELIYLAFKERFENKQFYLYMLKLLTFEFTNDFEFMDNLLKLNNDFLFKIKPENINKKIFIEYKNLILENKSFKDKELHYQYLLRYERELELMERLSKNNNKNLILTRTKKRI